MKIIFTRHAKRKFKFLRELNWNFDVKQIKTILQNPDYLIVNNNGIKGVLKSITPKLDLRIIYSEKDDIITIITFYPAPKRRYRK